MKARHTATGLVILIFLASCSREQQSMPPEQPRPATEKRSLTEPERSIQIEPEPGQLGSVAVELGDDTEHSGEAEAPPEELDSDEEYETAPTVARDLATELNVAVGSVRDCMQDDDAIVRSRIEVSATALVLPTGTVTQPSVTGRGLSQAERHCVATRVRAAVLEPLEDQTSRRITTRILVDLSAPAPDVTGHRVGPEDPALRNVRDPLPKRPEVAPSGRPIQEPTSRPIQEPTSRPIQEPRSRKVRGPQPRPIDGWEVDESSKDWR